MRTATHELHVAFNSSHAALLARAHNRLGCMLRPVPRSHPALLPGARHVGEQVEGGVLAPHNPKITLHAKP
jgi:hypothetical protein